MKINFSFLVPGIIVLGLTTVGCRPAAARAPQPAWQEPAPPLPPQPAYSPASAPSPDGPPPPPPQRARRPAPPPPPAACGPDTPPPPVAASAYQQGPPTTVRDTIRQFNYGPDGEISGFLLSNGTQVNVPREIGEQLTSIAKGKSEVTIHGYPRQSATGKTILAPTSITVSGQSIPIPAQPAGPWNAPPPPPPPAEGAAGPPRS